MSTHTSARNSKLSQELQDLIDGAVASGKVTKVQPAGLPGSETSRATNRLVAQRRAEFRKANKTKT